jgi:hypothetical protein
MRLHYVGSKPIVNQRGVSFDDTRPDRYTFLSAALELLETLDFDEEQEERHIKKPLAVPYDGKELERKVEEICDDIDALLAKTEEKTRELISELEEKVTQTSLLGAEEKRAWLGNIASMREYYLQYITNETVYRCLLEKMADRFIHSGIREITFPLKNNYGLVLQDLSYILKDHKPPFDAEIKVERREEEEGLFGRFTKLESPDNNTI